MGRRRTVEMQESEDGARANERVTQKQAVVSITSGSSERATRRRPSRSGNTHGEGSQAGDDGDDETLERRTCKQ